LECVLSLFAHDESPAVRTRTRCAVATGATPPALDSRPGAPEFAECLKAATEPQPPEFAQRALAALGPDAPLCYHKPPREPSRNPKYRGPAVKARERLAVWVRDPGISPNHWRHLFRTHARRAEVEVGIRDAICGHAPRPNSRELRGRNRQGHGRAILKFPWYIPEKDSSPSKGTGTLSSLESCACYKGSPEVDEFLS
jgi:hypothetical protein